MYIEIVLKPEVATDQVHLSARLSVEELRQIQQFMNFCQDVSSVDNSPLSAAPAGAHLFFNKFRNVVERLNTRLAEVEKPISSGPNSSD